ncbi:S8 family serine peptidase [Calditerricola satsumensis]|uniref:S8 family serine peptidase n=1 Tax=Calditerricola satsumensis TaxID=373054 RepID=UPI0006D036DE|nr:S8 family serine peptidase [Calditerricola satsumensis]
MDGNRDGNPLSYSKNDVVVAVIDTGIDAGHVDLDGGKVIGWKDFVNNRTAPYDDNGHGTHVAGIIAGEGQADSRYKGVVPGAALVGVKVLNASGSGSMSTVTAAIDWCIQNKDVYGIRVLNLSLGTSGSSDGTDATS